MNDIMMISVEHFLIRLDKYSIMKDHTSLIRAANKHSLLQQYIQFKYYLK